MTTDNIRWKQRFENFSKAFTNLQNGVKARLERDLNELEQQGLIHSFEFTFELAWKTLKDYLNYNSILVKFPRDVMKQAYQTDIIDNGDVWMDMLEKRNLMAHTYDDKAASLALELICGDYYDQLNKLFLVFSGKTNF